MVIKRIYVFSVQPFSIVEPKCKYMLVQLAGWMDGWVVSLTAHCTNILHYKLLSTVCEVMQRLFGTVKWFKYMSFFCMNKCWLSFPVGQMCVCISFSTLSTVFLTLFYRSLNGKHQLFTRNYKSWGSIF